MRESEQKKALGLIPEPPEVEEQKIYVRYITPEEAERVEEVVAEEVEKIRRMRELKKRMEVGG